MVFDIVIQTERNKKENELYPFRNRPFHPNLTVKPLTGKFYARHEFTDLESIDPEIEEAILNAQRRLPKDKFKEPLTGNMEYGWYVEPAVVKPKFNFHYPQKRCWITEIGEIIAKEDHKMPKKPFTGVAFKV